MTTYLQHNLLGGALSDLANRGVTFYYFATRADYNSYMNAHYPGPMGTQSPYFATTDRCGKTFYKPLYAAGLISAVWDSCTYAGTGQTTLSLNPSEAMQHESGHAFSIAVGNINGDTTNSGPADSVAYAAATNSGIVQDDLNIFDATWTPKSAAQRDAYLCTIFGNGNVLTDLEKDLGTTLVCPAGVINTAYKGLKPSVAIAKALPYFFTTVSGALYNDVWANRMIDDTGGEGGTEMLPETQHVLEFMTCMPSVQHGYYLTGVAPQTNDVRYNSCGNTSLGVTFTPPSPSTFH